jgi:hypothetical protein
MQSILSGFFLASILTASAAGCKGSDGQVPTCAATATPDVTSTAPFSIDTGVSPSTVGINYGQPSCLDQFLVDVDLTSAGFQGHDFFASGRWSLSLPVSPCDERVTMSVEAFDGNVWQPWDFVTYAAQMQGTVCHAQVQSHTNAASSSLGGASVPAAQHFKRVRLAVSAKQGNGAKVPVFVSGEAL